MNGRDEAELIGSLHVLHDALLDQRPGERAVISAGDALMAVNAALAAITRSGAMEREAAIASAARENFILEHPLGYVEAAALWDRDEDALLHAEAPGPYSYGSRYRQAEVMLEAARMTEPDDF